MASETWCLINHIVFDLGLDWLNFGSLSGLCSLDWWKDDFSTRSTPFPEDPKIKGQAITLGGSSPSMVMFVGNLSVKFLQAL
jgi:hypothetical protein